MSLRLDALPTTYAICRLAPDNDVPAWALRGSIWSIMRTLDELSIVCEEGVLPATLPPETPCERGWRALRVAGPLDFSLTGILAALTAPLADAGISIFALSTYDTDYLLVRSEAFVAACTALETAGYEIVVP